MFEVSDNGTPALKDTKTVTITVTTANRAPLANAQNLTTNEDTSLNLTLTGSDPDGDALSYVIVSNPVNGTLNGSGATRTYVPRQDFNGSDSFTFKANDGALDSNTATVTITVNAVNDAPVLTVPGAQSVNAGQPLSFTVNASDVDAGQALTLNATNLPASATFTQTSATSGQFNWSNAQAGNYTVMFRVADNGNPSLSDSKSVSILVNAPANPVPTIANLNPNTVTAGGVAFTLTVNGANFVNGSIVRWNGSNRSTAFVSSAQLTAQITVSDIANAGNAQVTVFNPAPGGGESNTVGFMVNPSCSYTLQPTSKSANASGGPDSFTVTTVSGCVWTASSNASWITINSGATGNGNGSVNYSVAANTSASQRVGTITAAGQTFSLTQAAAASSLTIASAASYQPGEVAVDSQALGIGTGLATRTLVAATNPLPTTLDGTTVRIRDSAGVERLALLVGVSPTKVIYHVAAGTATGPAVITVTSEAGNVASGTTQIVNVAPGLFTADGQLKPFSTNASGQGVVFAQALRVKPDGSLSYEPLYRFDEALNKHVAVPFEFGPTTDQIFLLLFGAGIRNRSALSAVSVRIGGVNPSVTYAGAQGQISGLDQINVGPLPRTLIGSGEVNVTATVDGKTSNTVQMNISGNTVPACSYTIQPTSQSFNGGGGSGTVAVTTTTGCAWTATSNASWLAVTAGATGAGSGSVSYSVAVNTGTSQRSGTLTVAGQTFTVTQSGSSVAAVVSAASYRSNVAVESVVACFGSNLATATAVASAVPLPTTLAGTTVKVRDSAGVERLAPLFFVSPGQINLQIPSGTAVGTATVIVTSGNGAVSVASVPVAIVDPGMFTFNASGTGPAFGQALRVKGDGTQTREQFISTQLIPINLGPPTDQVFLLLRGTGIRNRTNLSSVTARIGGVDATVSFAGPANETPYATSLGTGEDQITVLVPRSLTGRGEVDVVVTVEGKTANFVRVSIGTAVSVSEPR